MNFDFVNCDETGTHPFCIRGGNKENRDPNRFHLLFVDDNPVVRDVVKAVVSREGLTTSTVASGLEAIAFINDSRSANLVVMTDYSMPGLNGLELIHAIREQGHRNDVVLCSGEVAAIDWSTCVYFPTCVIEKPFDFRRLRRLLYRLCRPMN